MEAQHGVLSNMWWTTFWRSRRSLIQVLAVVVAAFALFAAGFVVGKHQSQVTVLTGVAAVGDHQALAEVDGWSYG